MKLRKTIKDKIEYGDIKAICEATKLSTATISNAKRNGKGSRKTIQAIESFYQNI